MEYTRCPVRYKKLVLMPTTWRKARRLCIEGKGILVKDKFVGWYLRLKVKPEGLTEETINQNQTIVLGIDPGSKYDGLSIVSRDNLVNLEIQHGTHRNKSESIKKLMNQRSMYRRLRRSRLRHRPIRFSNRTGNKLSATIHSMLQWRKFIISHLIKFYPISDIVIEDVKFNHYEIKGGKNFSNVEIGKNYLYNWINSLGINLTKVNGLDTSNSRKFIFGKDLKISNKASASFYAHCIDSFSIGLIKLTKSNSINKELIERSIKYLNTSVRFIHKVKWICKRELFHLEKVQGSYKSYFRYIPMKLAKYLKENNLKYKDKFNLHGKIINAYVFKRFSKLNKIRVKPSGEHSNHPKRWNYIYNELIETFKMNLQNYGGSIRRSRSHNIHKVPINKSKYLLVEFDKIFNKNIVNLTTYKHFYCELVRNKTGV